MTDTLSAEPPPASPDGLVMETLLSPEGRRTLILRGVNHLNVAVTPKEGTTR
jgi:hypothetical protein